MRSPAGRVIARSTRLSASFAAASARGDHGARDFLRTHADLVDVVDHPGDGRDLDTAADLDLLDDPTPR